MSTVDKNEIYRCNKWLRERYGADAFGNPNWRIVWSLDQLEKRPGTFNDFTPSGRFIREVKEIREVPKYPNLPGCWVLETKAVYEGDEICNHNGYDVIFPFVDKQNNRVDPDLYAVQFMFEVLMVYSMNQRTTADKAEEADKKAFDKDVERIEEGLSE